MITPQDIQHGLTWSQTGLSFLTWGHTILVAAWGFAAILGTFCHGILHVAPIAYEILLIKAMAETIGFGVKLDVPMKHQAIVFSMVMLVIGMILNVTHFIFNIVEFAEGSYQVEFWFLVVFTVILGVLIILEGILVYYFNKYKYHLGFVRGNKLK